MMLLFEEFPVEEAMTLDRPTIKGISFGGDFWKATSIHDADKSTQGGRGISSKR